MTIEDDAKKAHNEIRLVQNNLELLQNLLQGANIPNKEALLKHMVGNRGLLRPLGNMLSQLLEDPMLREALESMSPPAKEVKKH